MAAPEPERPALPDLAAGPRLLTMSVAWALLFAAGPGFLTPDGSLALGVVGLALWGATVLRPGRGRRFPCFLAEFLPNAIGGGALMAWVWYVYPGAFAYVAFGFGVYWTLAAVVVRRLARRLPAALAVGTGVLAVETLRALLPPPFGLGWVQLGHLTHHHLWLSTSARVFGLEGLSLVVAALGGLGASFLLGAHKREHGEPRLRLREVVFGLGPFTLAVLLSLVLPAPPERAGPLVLLVQPGFPQERKQHGDQEANFVAQAELTRAALDGLARGDADGGGRQPDLVVWAESMLGVHLFASDVPAAVGAGVPTPPWAPELTSADLEFLAELEAGWVRGALLGEGRYGHYGRAGGVVPDGTAFLAGTELFTVVGDGDAAEVRRRVCVALYEQPEDGTPATRAVVLKRRLVPGAESMLGLEQLGLVRDTIHHIASYVPDFVAGDEPGVLTLTDRSGVTWRFGASVCFDNAFLGTFTDAFAVPPADPDAGPAPVDFHLVVSNEAWYRRSFEMDQMVAFSRVAALATARSVVRGTNSGVSVVLGPDGVERGRVRDAAGDDRATAGTLALTVPVPPPERRGDHTVYVRTRPLWRVLALAAPLLALAVPRARRRTAAA